MSPVEISLNSGLVIISIAIIGIITNAISVKYTLTHFDIKQPLFFLLLMENVASLVTESVLIFDVFGFWLQLNTSFVFCAVQFSVIYVLGAFGLLCNCLISILR